ncbi:MAG: 1,4-dihydroxy-2-naphthoate octaprenyltransferase, partial [Actinobacteria bacterium]|nr:1,4-dihydroxy-2-naphthoate octaprenyltransferase [Actinomycetota bacterium]
VRLAAFMSFAVAAILGVILVGLVGQWWLLLVGVASVAAAWLYTGGPSPYGYFGLGEVFVFVFFGLVAVAGSTYVHTLTITWRSIGAGVASGSLAVAILLANNLRDIPTDVVAGKKTLAVRLGDPRTRVAYSIALAIPYVIAVAIAISGTPWALLAFASAPLTLSPLRQVRGGAVGRGLIPVLVSTGVLLLGYAVSLSIGLVISAV